MEHEAFVPVPAERLGEALADPVRVARAIPGLQQDAEAEPVSGRLKVRVAGHTITYRGVLRVAARPDGSYTAHCEATEVRGTGTVKLSLSVRLLPADGGTNVLFTGTATGDGRIAELPADAVASAGARLLGRFAEGLGAGGTAGAAASGEAAGDRTSEEPSGQAPTEEAQAAAGQAPEGSPEKTSGTSSADASATPSIHDTEVPPPSLDPLADADGFVGEEEPEEDFDGEGELPPAEAAHARRTMIGRSAEEVDHAPPRGRYAPVPVPETVAAGATLRWAAPAAALLLASAIVAARLLRRRR
ncbi:carbon monoxide dehydrogenase subunit G [Streptomyces sp. NPDC093228]|jgi:carbon monoxide dehydrogenase subunit G|uniref:carbon monoxide dehydrogenase subunit G n=1 Tax=unclassified Streptomyces TaxID=2593676 RepID=UPI003440E5E3